MMHVGRILVEINSSRKAGLATAWRVSNNSLQFEIERALSGRKPSGMDLKRKLGDR